MKENNDDMVRLINEVFEKDADDIDKEIKKDDWTELSDKKKERIKKKIDLQIEKYEREVVYSKLSEEDFRALKVGQEIIESQKQEEESTKKVEKKVVKKKIPLKVYVGLAAALVMTMGLGINSIGGPERIVEFFTQKIGDREVSKVTTGGKSALSTEEKEEEAYQTIKDELKVEPVRMSIRTSEIIFDKLELNSLEQSAEIIYKYKDSYLHYYASIQFDNSSWGYDIEDKKTDEWIEEIKGCQINITEYSIPNLNTPKFSAEFEYMGVGYLIVGTMDKSDFNKIIKNLYFYKM